MPDARAIFTRGRLLQIMDALERTGCTPVDLQSLHSFAFFVNVLSPLWDLHPLEGSVLKQKDGPYYPVLQQELDNLVGVGLVSVTTLALDVDRSPPELVCTFVLCPERASVVLDEINALPDEVETTTFLLELASAFAEILPKQRDDAASVDASYSDPAIANGRVIDFGEWVSPTRGNPTWNAVQTLQSYAPPNVQLSRAEKLAMYMSLMKRRAHG